MKIFNIKRTYDYGHNIYFDILKINEWVLFQLCFTFNDYGRSFPYLNITFGNGRFLSFIFEVHRIGICFDLISRYWDQY